MGRQIGLTPTVTSPFGLKLSPFLSPDRDITANANHGSGDGHTKENRPRKTHARKHGWLARMSTRNGRNILKRRMAKGHHKLVLASKPWAHENKKFRENLKGKPAGRQSLDSLPKAFDGSGKNPIKSTIYKPPKPFKP